MIAIEQACTVEGRKEYKEKQLPIHEWFEERGGERGEDL
jgi:hypothetical protein